MHCKKPQDQTSDILCKFFAISFLLFNCSLSSLDQCQVQTRHDSSNTEDSIDCNNLQQYFWSILMLQVDSSWSEMLEILANSCKPSANFQERVLELLLEHLCSKGRLVWIALRSLFNSMPRGFFSWVRCNVLRWAQKDNKWDGHCNRLHKVRSMSPKLNTFARVRGKNVRRCPSSSIWAGCGKPREHKRTNKTYITKQHLLKKILALYHFWLSSRQYQRTIR